MNKLMTIIDAARLLGVSHAAIKYAVRKGRLHAVMGGIDGRRIKGLLANEVYDLVAIKDRNISIAKEGGNNR